MSYKKAGLSAGRQGFTIIELLVVIFIIAITSGIMVVNFRKGEGRNRLQISAQKIVQDIRKAQSMAISSVQYQNNVPPAYGVFFNDNQDLYSYKIFADQNDNEKWDSSDDSLIGGKDISLEKGIKIDYVSPSPNLHITFAPPHAFTKVFGGATEGKIRIKKEGGSCPQDCKTIIIRELVGWIDIQ